MQKKIIIVGGGAAGLMAAVQASLAGANVLLIEKMKQPGRKIGISGKGRCNITNIAELEDFIGHFGKNGRFLRQAFGLFFNTDLINLFKKLGLEVVIERGGRVFPKSGKATDVTNCLLDWFKKNGGKIQTSSGIDKLLIKSSGIIGVSSGNEDFQSDCVILATGGASYPATGSTGDGYALLKNTGHSITPIRPALVPLTTSSPYNAELDNLELRNVMAALYINGKKKREEFGELAFKKYGFTGPVILTLSGDAVDSLKSGHDVAISLDLKPALDEKKLDARLMRDISSRGKENFESFLRGLLPQPLINVCAAATSIDQNKKVCTITAKERSRLRIWLKNFRLEVNGHRPMSEAIITAGGVNIKEVNPRTMESNIIRGLFIAGELLDIHADTGGYNLQAAFSTGWLAGRSAAAAL